MVFDMNIYICHRHGTWVKEKMERFGCIYSKLGSWHGCRWMCRWMAMFPMHMCSGFPTGRLEQTIVTSFHDVTRMSHAIEGGNYKRRAQPNLRAVVWVFWYKVFRSIHKPQTLYFGYLGASHGAEHNQNGLCDLFIFMHVPRPFWGNFSQYDFSCLTLAR